LAPVTITNPPSWNTINIDDSADPSSRTVTLSTVTPPGDTAWGQVTGLAPAAIRYKYADTSSVHITTGTGADTVNVWETGVTTYISTSGVQSTVNVGSGSVQGILGALYVDDPPGYTTLNINDLYDNASRLATLSTFSNGPDAGPWGSITGLAP